jgi:hypothetical protein
MTDEPNAALPEPLAHAMQGEMPREDEPTLAWHDSDDGFQYAYDADREPKYRWQARHPMHPDRTGSGRDPAQAAGCAAAGLVYGIWSERRQLTAAETALDDARAEVEWLREALELIAGVDCWLGKSCDNKPIEGKCLPCIAISALAAARAEVERLRGVVKPLLDCVYAVARDESDGETPMPQKWIDALGNAEAALASRPEEDA